jgi:hypothetical protein
VKAKKNFVLPEKGFVFWPVGCGDSTTIAVTDEAVMQVDLHHLSCSELEDDPRIAIVDQLVAILPHVNNKPYLAVFVLTHPDEDHCLGFAQLLKKVNIGELWFSPRVFREYKKDLCDDAKAFKAEAERRVAKTIKANGDVASGDVVRIIGYDELLKEDEFKGFPSSRLSVPGHSVVELDGFDYSQHFSAFLHGPFKDDADGERNDCSIAMQVTLKNPTTEVYAMLLADHCYPTLKRIFDCSDDSTLRWHVLQAPHHCSKSAMYWMDEGDKEECLKQGILDSMESAAQSPGLIVASCECFPAKNEPGDNPPHKLARSRYEEIAPDGFLCTQEHGDSKSPEPVIFNFTEKGLEYSKVAVKKSNAPSLAAAAAAARGSSEPPTSRIGFGGNRKQ